MDSEFLTLDQLLQQKQSRSLDIVDVNETTVKLVVFSLVGEWYAFYGANISEILPQNTVLFFVPGCPPSLAGVINLRGEIESVLYIDLLLQLDREPLPGNSILMAKSVAMRSGIYVDEVIDVIDVVKSEIIPPSETLPDHLRPNVSGILQHAGRAVTVLNLEQLFTHYLNGLG